MGSLFTQRKLPLAFALGAVLALIQPSGAALGRSVYVANADGNNLSVINSDTNAVEAGAIGVGARPVALAITPDGQRIYVANRDGNSISVIDTATRGAIATISVPLEGIIAPAPLAIAISPGGTRAYVANRDTHDVAVIDTGSNSVIGDVELGVLRSARGIAVSADGARVYVSADDPDAPDPDNVSIIDAGFSQLTGSVALAANSSPQQIAVTPDGRRAYVALANQAYAAVIDTTTNTVVAQPALLGSPDAPSGVAITPNGSRAYVTDFDKPNIWPIDTASNQGVAPLSVGTGDPSLAIMPDGSRAYVASVNSHTVPVVDVASGATLANLAGMNRPWAVAITPDQGPVANFASTVASAGTTTTFDGSASTDVDGTVARYDWNFGDGTTAENAGPKPTHTYQKAGAYEVALTVTDNEGASTTQVFTGQTVSLNGSAAARRTESITVPADTKRPRVRITYPKSGARVRRRAFRQTRGTAEDAAGILRVQFAIALRGKIGKSNRASATRGLRRCRFLNRRGRIARRLTRCSRPRYLLASGTSKWRGRVRRRLPRGRYLIIARAKDNQGNTSRPVRRRFTIR